MFKRELLKNKLYGVVIIGLGALSVPIEWDGTFGESVTYELAVAKYLGKPRGVYHPT